MIVNLTQLLVLLFFFFSFFNCNVYEDIKLKRQGCNYNPQLIFFCTGYFQKVNKNEETDSFDSIPCLRVIYQAEQCKRKLSESDIP